MNTRYSVGNILIILSLLLVSYTYYPIINLYLFPPGTQMNTFDSQTTTIYIPKINAFAPVIQNVDPWNESQYQEALKKGVAEAKGYHNFLFAHSSLPPWEMTRTNTAFLRLPEIMTGDEIIIKRDGQEYKFKVIGKYEIWPDQVEYLKDLGDDLLVLQTCTPVGTALKRLLVFAKLK